MASSVIDRASCVFRARDGLSLHYFDYSPARERAGLLPVVCLPGLTRPADDFDAIALTLARAGRRVISFDHRGRGASDWDPDWSHYSLDVEQQDLYELLARTGVREAVFLGTSRGGLHIMRLAAADPKLVRAAVFNDIGPKIEVGGLLRIKRYVGKLPPLQSMKDAVGLMRLTAGAYFSGVDPDHWETYARQTFMEKDGKVVVRFDPNLAHTLDEVAPGAEIEEYWPQFATMTKTPLLVIRGGESDLFLADTVAEMARRHPGMEAMTIPGQGHAPLLLDEATITRIAEFVARAG
jgi:pimeloyl-ACP methyl ester carboxylesterase